MDKKIIFIYTGYSESRFTGQDYQQTKVRGSEISAIMVAEQLVLLGYIVYVFCESSYPHHELTHNGVKYIYMGKMQYYMDSLEVDTLIVLRFIHAFIDFEIKAKKTIVWLQDNCFNFKWSGKTLTNNGISFVNNIHSLFDKVVLLSDYHKQLCISSYKVPSHKYEIIGNGINTCLYKNKPEKQNLKFTYCSCPTRGLPNMLDIFMTIKKKYPEATLDICWGSLPEEISNKIKTIPGVTFLGRLSQQDLANQLLKTQFWIYPIPFETPETYCINALQAQAAGCICIYPENSCLFTTIGDRGILIKGVNPEDKQWQEEAIHKIDHLLSNEGIMNTLSEKAREWGLRQSWENRAIQWTTLIGSI